jgi:hypothetical protein
METLEIKSSLSQIKNTVANHSALENRISGLEDKEDAMEKNG